MNSNITLLDDLPDIDDIDNISNSSITRMKSMTMRTHSSLMRMEFRYHLPRRSRTS